MTLTDNGTSYTITGPGFYATTSPGLDGLPGLTRFSYLASGNVFLPKVTGETLYVSNTATLALTGRDTSDSERELELFITYLYGTSVQIQNSPYNFALDLQLTAAGKLSVHPALGQNFYNKINVFDFMVMTGAIEYPITSIAIGERRPIVREAVQRDDKSLMFTVIQKLGIWGYCVNIFAEYGMTLQELADCIALYKTDPVERQVYVLSYIVPFLRTKGFRFLIDSELQTLFGNV